MNNRHLILDLASRAGFGGESRVKLHKKLALFAALIAEHHADLCNQIGDQYRDGTTEFRDGQMDGAYQCAEIINKNFSV